MVRSGLFQYLLIALLVLWPLWLALLGLGMELFKGIRPRFIRREERAPFARPATRRTARFFQRPFQAG